MSAVILQNEIVHYEVLGRGRPIIFLHGWVGSWRYWIPAMQAASISFRTYALDLWGFGDSAKNPYYYAIENQTELLDQFLQEMGIGKIALVGHGLGAVIALLYTAKYPRFVDRLMTVCLPNDQSSINPRLTSTSPLELAGWLLDRSTSIDSVFVEAPKADQKAIQSSITGLQQVSLEELALNLSKPCLMVYGQGDPAVTMPPVEKSIFLPEHIHQIIFEQSGHFPMLDETSKFNRLLADFLSLSSGDSPRQLQLKEEWKRRVR